MNVIVADMDTPSLLQNEIWVLTSGGYSDYRVEGLFDNLEDVEKAKALYPNRGWNDPI